MNTNELTALKERERLLWEATIQAQTAYDQARDAWVEVKHQVDAANLEALIEARVADKLAAEQRGQEAA